MWQVEGQVQRARFQKELDLSVKREGQRSCSSRSTLAEGQREPAAPGPEVHGRISIVR